MNFTEHCIDRDIIAQFVDTIIPRTETCFEWYLNFDLVEKPMIRRNLYGNFPLISRSKVISHGDKRDVASYAMA